MRKIGVLWATVAALGLAGCGHDSPTARVATTNAHGTLVEDPPARLVSLDASAIVAQLNASSTGQQLLALAGPPACGVDVYYLKYWTVAPTAPGSSMPIMDSGALMVPTGSAAQCSGGRPIMLYAHATTVDATYNIADVLDPTQVEGLELAVMYAAQGYIVVAPNFAGYDISTLGYYPFLNAQQNADEMMDALTAARTALLSTFTPSTTDGGELFVTGYSIGGFVAMATDKAMQAAGETVTATAPMSGPYAAEAFGDAIMTGHVNFDAPEFAVLTTTSYQRAYGNVYSATTDVYSPQYAAGIDSLLPSATPLATLIQEGKLPQSALFSSTPPTTGIAAVDALLALPSPPNPVYSAGFGNPFLISNSYRVSYVEDVAADPDGADLSPPASGVPLAASPQNALRQDLKVNDMRSWTPRMPMLLCGGDQDPVVFFGVNTGTMEAYWQAQVSTGLVSVLDVNAAPAAGDPYAGVQEAFRQAAAQTVAQVGAQAALEQYHTAVAPFCMAAARGFFGRFLPP